jgi:hypothetical protein
MRVAIYTQSAKTNGKPDLYGTLTSKYTQLSSFWNVEVDSIVTALTCRFCRTPGRGNQPNEFAIHESFMRPLNVIESITDALNDPTLNEVAH